MKEYGVMSVAPDRLFFRMCSFVEWKCGLRPVVSISEPTARIYTESFIKTHRLLVNNLHTLFSKRYTDADPFKLVFVNPADIENSLNVIPRRGWVVGGDEERHYKQFFELPIPRCLKKRYEQGISWYDPELKKEFISALEQNQDDWTYTDDAYETQCKKIDNLYESIKQDGYRSQKEMLKKDPNSTHARCNDTVHPRLNEIGISIDHNGDLLWSRCGKHRLAIAKILNTDSIPVMVYLRHREWQSIRNEVSSKKQYGNLSEKAKKLINHPDLKDIVPSNW